MIPSERTREGRQRKREQGNCSQLEGIIRKPNFMSSEMQLTELTFGQMMHTLCLGGVVFPRLLVRVINISIYLIYLQLIKSVVSDNLMLNFPPQCCDTVSGHWEYGMLLPFQINLENGFWLDGTGTSSTCPEKVYPAANWDCHWPGHIWQPATPTLSASPNLMVEGKTGWKAPSGAIL